MCFVSPDGSMMHGAWVQRIGECYALYNKPGSESSLFEMGLSTGDHPAEGFITTSNQK